jgi:hypothetical protein
MPQLRRATSPASGRRRAECRRATRRCSCRRSSPIRSSGGRESSARGPTWRARRSSRSRGIPFSRGWPEPASTFTPTRSWPTSRTRGSSPWRDSIQTRDRSRSRSPSSRKPERPPAIRSPRSTPTPVQGGRRGTWCSPTSGFRVTTRFWTPSGSTSPAGSSSPGTGAPSEESRSAKRSDGGLPGSSSTRIRPMTAIGRATYIRAARCGPDSACSVAAF